MKLVARLISTLVLLVAVIGCDGCGSNPVEPEDTTRPTVVSTSPVDGDMTVAMSTAITVTFSERMDATSLVDGILSLDPTVAGTISSTATSFVFTPTDGLDTNVTYTATLATSVQDTAGNNLSAPHVWQFRTYFDTEPPTIIETTPPDSNTSVSVNSDITAFFSESMDRSTLIQASFQISPSVAGVISSTDTSITFDPDDALDTLQWYTVTLAADIADATGNHLATEYIWDFYTYPDTTSPTAMMISPIDGGVIDNSVTIEVNASDNDEIDYVEFYVDGSLVVGGDDYTAPYECIWDASGFEFGSEHTVSAVAYDAVGNSISTDTATVHYMWRLLVDEDPDELGMPRNLKNVWYRTTDQQIQFRVETWNGWGEYNDSALGIDVVFFLDTDQNPATGDTETDSLSPKPIGDIGADYQMVVGYHGLFFRSWTGTAWGDFEGVEDLLMANDTNKFEVAMSLVRLNDPEMIDLVVANIHVPTHQWDWAPDSSSAIPHVTAIIDRSFSPAPAARKTRPGITPATIHRTGPFD
jgi:hypothetical protein